ncbi:hypothetical protein ACH5RR_024049 [Cinchona calisaya]|uniref:Glycosyl transferase CAP10 domain-containing protein n=1 Tax=Cinchona calisaya TaxID=153742 RepID=A0ABD2ZFH2_9GENT
MSFQDEKLKNIFWLRPAYQKNSWGAKWRLLYKTSLALATNILLLLLFVLIVSFLAFLGWIYVVNHSSISYENALKFFNKSTKSIPPPLPPLEYPLDCIAWDQSKTCTNNYPTTYKPSNRDRSSNPTCPDYFRWIHEDLKPWKVTGITRDMVERARETAHFRLVILYGKVYVEKFRESIQTRALFTIWGIVQLVRLYPGKLPDLELMFDCDDRPVIPSKDYRGPNARPPALFRYCSDWWSLDIVFPDWSFWGWAEANINPWRNILKDIKEGNEKVKWKDREPYAYWKGNPHVAPWRGDLMTCNPTDKDDWNTRLFIQDWNEEEKKGFIHSNLADQCTYRYKIYIEGHGWSVSEKYVFACDSPVLLMTPRFHDFFIRGMVPQRHYWPVRDGDKCRSLKFAVEYGNNHTQKAEAIGAAGSHFIHEDMKMEYVFDYIFHLLNEYAKLLKFKPIIPPNSQEICAEALACPTDGKGRKFKEESLEKSPSNSIPCKLPPPYDLQALKAFNDEKFKLTKEVEKWESEYWDKLSKNP